MGWETYRCGAVPEKDDVFLVGLGGEAQDVPRYQSMAVDLVEGWRPRPDLLQDPAGRYVPSLGVFKGCELLCCR
ncbi:hypothetical protein M2368_003808 [Arthrobacter sp. JUb119]|nr:hypothetical protein [Arthrobacter sp. JUb119]TDU18038.1 hypothetical protein EDF61_1233 [Arthrobacter sp. JUb115]